MEVSRFTERMSLLAAVLGVILPALFWIYDQRKAVEVNVSSMIALQPKGAADVGITFDNAVVAEGFITSVEILNSGTKPIPAADFEGDAHIAVSNARVLRATVEKTNPSELVPVVTLISGVIHVQALLLNPGDRFTISVLTEGGRPEISFRARISGISKIGLNRPPQRPNWIRTGLRLLMATLCMAGYLLLFMTGVKRWRLRPWVYFALALTLGVAGVEQTRVLLTTFELLDHFQSISIAVGLALSTVAYALRRHFLASGTPQP